MAARKCPGQDLYFWKHDDIFQAPCANCGEQIEFFRDDLRRRCPHCKKYTVNPKNDLSCAAWCKYGRECLGQMERVDDRNNTESDERKPSG